MTYQNKTDEGRNKIEKGLNVIQKQYVYFKNHNCNYNF
jgi:hypothetical protein